MIDVQLFVYGHANQINWSVWRFASVPSQGDKIAVARDGVIHNLVVQHVEHSPVPSGSTDAPSVSVIAHWKGEDRA